MGSTEDRDHVSIAIIGLSCRFPGDGENLEVFWDSLCNGKSAWSEIPTSRWKGDSFWGPTKKRNTAITKGAHFIKSDISTFDATFFNISSAEASAMDPQHRLMTEVAYEAVESAGLPVHKLQGSRTGVWMGHFTSDYKELIYSDPMGAPAYAATSLQKTSLANRISWLWDLRGPSFTLDTACSSSLVALHVACQSLRTGESDMAIVGGSNLLLGPEVFMFFGGQGFLSPDGKSKSFDTSANGYGRGEGFAAVVLKRADDAIRDGDPIRAIIRGTACNQDGHTKGFTLPSHEAQRNLINEVYQLAGLEFEQTGYVEAHGTGTQAGDVEETMALSQTISAAHSAANKLFVGSVKANIGHLEAVAGLAAIIKSVLILEHGMIPPNIHLKTPNPKIPFDDWNLKVPTSLTPFPSSKRADGVRRISVNSFGYGGTNAHAILDDAASYLKSRGISNGLHYTKALGFGRGISTNAASDSIPVPAKLLFPISSQDRDGLKRTKKALSSYLESQSSSSLRSASTAQQAQFLQDIAFTLSDKRSLLQWKTYAIASSSSIADLVRVLGTKDTSVPETLSSRTPRLGFIFTGQGAQWAGMGMELFEDYAVFRESVEAADIYLRDELGCEWSAIDELKEADKSKSNISVAAYSQPLCTVLQVALVELLRTWNITPQAVTGHSSGEIAAAYAVGALSRESAWKAAFFRGTLSTALKEVAPDLQGAMMALGVGAEAAAEMIKRAKATGQVCVACVNSPSSVTISGDAVGVDKMLVTAEAEGAFARKLRVDAAYHSFHMQMISQDYMESIYDLQVEPSGSESNVKMVTSVTGSAVEDLEEYLGPAHWVKNLVSPVLFEPAVQNLVRPLDQNSNKRTRENAVDILVEIGPHSALQGPSLQSLKAIGVTNVPYFSALTRNLNGVDTALALAGTLFSHGVPVNFTNVNKTPSDTRTPRTLVHLPSYPWNHSQKYWAESRVTREHRLRDFGARSLIGAPCPVTSTEERIWRGFLRLKEEPWVADHKIQGSILYPGAGFLAMAVEGARQLAFSQDKTSQNKSRAITGFRLRDVQLVAAMLVPADKEEVEHTLSLRPQEEGWYQFTVASSIDGQPLTRNCTGRIVVEYNDEAEDEAQDAHLATSFQAALSSCKDRPIDRDQFYSTLTKIGFHYGPSFANVASLSSAPNTAFGSIAIPDVGFTKADTELNAGPEDLYHSRPHIIHPTFLDAVFHLCFAALMGDGSTMATAMVPTSIDEICVNMKLPIEPGKDLQGFCRAERAGLKNIMAEMAVMDPSDQASKGVLIIRGLCCSEVAGGASSAASEFEAAAITRKYASKPVWQPHISLMSNEELKQWVADKQKSKSGKASIDNVVAEYIKLQHHIVPGVSVLEFAAPGSVDAPQVLAESLIASKLGVDLAHVLNSGHYAVCVPTDDAAVATKSLLQSTLPPKLSDLVDVEVLDVFSKDTSIEADTPDQESISKPRVADLILVSNLSTYNIEHAEEALRKATKQLSDNGRLLLVEHNAETASKLRDLAGQISFSVDVEFEVATGVVIVLENNNIPASTSQTNGVNGTQEGEEVILLSSPSASETAASFHSALGACLSSASFSPSTVAWDPSQVSSLKGKTVISLIELEKPFWRDVSQHSQGEAEFTAAQDLILSAGSVFWITGFDDPAAEMMNGIARVVRNEVPGSSLRTLNIFDGLDARAAELVSRIFVRHNLSRAGPDDTEFKVEGGVVQVSRLVVDDDVNDEVNELVAADAGSTRRPIEKVALSSLDDKSPLRLAIGAAANFDTLHFVEEHSYSAAEDEDELAEDEVEISIKASRLSEADVATLNGKSHADPALLGMEAAGIITRIGSKVGIGNEFKPGDRVMVLSPGAHRTLLRAKADFVAHVPENMSLEQAAGLLGPFVTAWYALVDVARLGKTAAGSKRGAGTILVHDATSAVGQQVVYMARQFGLSVLASVDSRAQAEFLVYVLLVEPDHIVTLESHSVFSLAQAIRRLTKEKRGVDLAIDCSGNLAGEALGQVMSSVASFGHFVRCVANSTSPSSTAKATTGLGTALMNITVSNIDLALLRQDRPELLVDLLRPAVQFLQEDHHHHYSSGSVRCVPIGVMATAFRELQSVSGENVVLTYSSNDVVPARLAAKRPSASSSAARKVTLDPEGIYILSGGLGGLGRSLSTFFIDQLGARKLVFFSRSGAASSPAAQFLSDLESHPARPQVAVYACDVSNGSAVRSCIDKAKSELGGEVRGIVQCAMVLRDVLWSNMTYTQWVESTLPKVQGTANLSTVLPDVDFFISLSSFAGIFGNRGQANYAAGNCYLDALARHRRRSLGLKAGFTIDLPIMSGIGVLAETGMLDSLRDWEAPYGVGEAEFHHILRKAIRRDMNLEAELQDDHEMVVGIATGASAQVAGIQIPFYLVEEAKFAIMKDTDMRYLKGSVSSTADAEGGDQPQESIQVLLSRATDLDEAAETITQALVARVAKMQQVGVDEIDSSRFLHSYGVDSLVAIEMVSWALKEVKSKITVFDVTAGTPITALAEKIARNSELVAKEVREG